MQTIAGFPFFSLDFDKTGTLTADGKVERNALAMGLTGKTDLLVISHGWNNDVDDAHGIYDTLLKHLAELGAKPATTAVAGIFWPSKTIPDDWFAGHPDLDASASGTGVGGAATVGGTPVISQEARAHLDSEVDDFAALLGLNAAKTGKLKAAVNGLGNVDLNGRAFAAQVLAVAPKPPPGATVDVEDVALASMRALAAQGTLSIVQLGNIVPLRAPTADGDGGAAHVAVGGASPDILGSAAGLADFAKGLMAGASRFLNFATYYVMKERAGIVGGGLNTVLAGLRAQHDGLAIHLVGHSFGARLVTAAAAGSAKFSPRSMSLLQGAFSHNGFANKKGFNGFFRKVVEEARVKGPIVVTHTRHDRAVGWAYAIASRASGVNAAALGDASDPYGGIGSNGAQNLDEVTQGDLLAVGKTYSGWRAGGVNNLRGDPFITGHGAVTGKQVAQAVLTAMRFP